MRYHIITLGCPKNAVDSEGMGGILAAQGHTSVVDASTADVIIVNTCSFIAAARDETLNVLREVAATKQENQQLIAAGCMAESHQTLVQTIPGVDATLSTREWMRIGEVITSNGVYAHDSHDFPDQKEKAWDDIIPLSAGPTTPPTPLSPDLSVPGNYADWRTAPIRRYENGPSAYLKISDGCNLRCSFCTIPSFKGDMRSKALGAILGEAQDLAKNGVKEIVLVAQHLTDYGRDLKIQDGLATLLEELCAILPQDTWIRLMYAYPHGINDRLIETMARHPQICTYLDMPLQHADPATLRRMRRPPDTERTKTIIRNLRSAMPDIAIRSTFIVGFPGETRKEFVALLDFLAEIQLDRVGVFQYSHEPGTHAATLPQQVASRTIERRWHEVMQLQQEISFTRNQQWAGRTITMLVEGQGHTEAGEPLVVGRSFRDAPEVDGQVFAWGHAQVGQLIPIRITQALAYDLWGELCDA
ncbi:MAG: tRNA A37 methylthiotransferase MiaB [Chloroflexi bacterium AL-W]|nr:tRNA A37 methylthiotransferase MiaB [Chloroflexi bacterium AL-N1]NOK71688.1 tRNA A37 methylthiotransferase MiaB [Chloroflexi bacterium AL-N10]NOK79029.1 tRNA A37 methylthiotransferase MiaB [Chloroflexi bacterium AL-N5]NOK86463.1 tRNA A37 methylthiotransferase MiaB [Chloroflexi bacterium AL-W]NOK93429.1 tRNA A37 methylthiotransferase MiaB [Chloroflexi bacterium AL-N15]